MKSTRLGIFIMMLKEIKKSLDNNRTPILVGGTMMYYNSLFKGLSDLPKKDEKIRKK